MDHNISNIRMDIIKQASDKVLYLYNHVSLSNFASTLDSVFHTNVAQDYTFDLLVGDIILGFYRIEDTVPLLQQELGLDPKTAALLGAEVLEFLAPLSDPNWQPPAEEEMEDTPGEGEVPVVAATVPASTTTATTKTTETTPVIPTTPTPLHTMAADMATLRQSPTPAPSYLGAPTPVETVYRSEQPPLRQTLSDLPTYQSPSTPPVQPPTPAASDRPRWSTDY